MAFYGAFYADQATIFEQDFKRANMDKCAQQFCEQQKHAKPSILMKSAIRSSVLIIFKINPSVQLKNAPYLRAVTKNRERCDARS